MENRHRDLSELKLFTRKIDKEITMLLQSLQWNQSKLMEETVKETCRHNPNHKIPPDKREIHEQTCFLTCQGYSKEDKLLPDPWDYNANTLVKLSKDDITQIIENARKADPLFKSVDYNVIVIVMTPKNVLFIPGVDTSEPCTLDRLQATYTADERRAIHNAVVESVPFCHDLTDLALPSTSGDDPTATRDKSRAEILAELRDMKRRRTKYRVAAKTQNYSDVLRDVIKTQMELYTEVQTETEIKTEPIEVADDSRHASEHKYYKQNPNKTIDKDSLHNSANKKNNNYRRETCIEDRQNKETSRYYLNDDRANATYKDRRHNVHDKNIHKEEFQRRDESRDKYHSKSNRETRNDDHYKSKYNNERDRTRDERYDRKHSDRYDKYQNKASTSKDYKNSQKRDYRDEKHKEKYKAYDSRDIKEEGKYKRYYDDITTKTSNEDKLKRTKYS